MLHITLHFLVPLLVSVAFFRSQWARVFALLMAGMIIDVDHLLATPIYDPGRCSIGFHPLHTIIPITFYLLALMPKRTRLIALGLCIHIALDSMDCYVTNGVFYTA